MDVGYQKIFHFVLFPMEAGIDSKTLYRVVWEIDNIMRTRLQSYLDKRLKLKEKHTALFLELGEMQHPLKSGDHLRETFKAVLRGLSINGKEIHYDHFHLLRFAKEWIPDDTHNIEHILLVLWLEPPYYVIFQNILLS